MDDSKKREYLNDIIKYGYEQIMGWPETGCLNEFEQFDTKSSKTKCIQTTKEGTRCTRLAIIDSMCLQHYKISQEHS
jgi:hypothetical protein